MNPEGILTVGSEPTPHIWDEIFRSQNWGKYPPDHVVRFVAGLPRGRVLDLGCGPGSVSWFLAREGFDVSALDFSPTAVGQLQSRLQSEGLECDARVGDFTHGLPWKDESFEAVIDNVAIYTCGYQAAKRTMAEVNRVLKPGGRFLSVTFGTETSPSVFQGRGYALLIAPGDIEDLYSAFSYYTVDSVTYTRNGAYVDLWVVNCWKTNKEQP